MKHELRIKNTASLKFITALLILWLYTTFLLLSVSEVWGQTMQNDEFILQMGNLNSISGRTSGSNYQLSFTSGQTPNNLFSGPNYKVRAGFQYIYTLLPFRFSISNIFIDFGVISPTSPVTRTNLLTVSNESANGYRVTVSQNHNLRVDASGFEIPATTCDSGNCTSTTSDAWTSSLTFGFGYRCDNVTGTDCTTGFSNADYYKSFISSPSAVTIMSSANRGKNRKSQVTYKVNIAGTQAAGLYRNVLNYIAIPTY